MASATFSEILIRAICDHTYNKLVDVAEDSYSCFGVGIRAVSEFRRRDFNPRQSRSGHGSFWFKIVPVRCKQRIHSTHMITPRHF